MNRIYYDPSYKLFGSKLNYLCSEYIFNYSFLLGLIVWRIIGFLLSYHEIVYIFFFLIVYILLFYIIILCVSYTEIKISMHEFHNQTQPRESWAIDDVELHSIKFLAIFNLQNSKQLFFLTNLLKYWLINNQS